MGDVLDEAYAIAQCKECPWYKACVIPMRFSAEDIRRQLEASAPGFDMSQQADLGIQNFLSSMATAAQNSLLEGCPIFIERQADLGIQNFLSSMATAAQNSLLEGCPIFIERLRSNPKLAQRLKQMMQEWGREE